MAAKLQKDEYKRRVLSLERDLEAYKSVGGKPPMSRVQRAIKTAFGEQQGHDTLADLTELCIAAEDKENTSATYSTDINNIV